MALPATTVWEVRTDGSDTNGGGYSSARSGTDYTQRATPILTVTDLACTTGGAVCTNTTGDFTAAMEGSICYISGTHFTTGWYEIVTYTNAHQITLDRDPTDGSDASSGTCNVGGALATPEKAAALYVADNTIYLKYSATPYDTSTGVSMNTVGNLGKHVLLQGYDSTRSKYNNDANRPTIRATAGSITIVDLTLQNTAIDNVVLDGNGQSSIKGVDITQLYTFARKCKAVECTTWGFSGQAAISCEADTCNDGFSAAYCIDCYAHDCTDDGFVGIYAIINCISVANDGDGFESVIPCLVNCVAYANGANGFNLGGLTGLGCINCIAEGHSSGKGFTRAGYDGAHCRNCAAYNNASGSFDAALVQFDCQELADESPFTNAAAGDFSLKTTGNGALLRAAGFPGTLTQGSVGYPDIGVVQHADHTPAEIAAAIWTWGNRTLT